MNNDFPLILAFVKDLNSSVRIESASEKQGFEVKILESADQIAPPDDHESGHLVAEPVQGRNGIFFPYV